MISKKPQFEYGSNFAGVFQKNGCMCEYRYRMVPRYKFWIYATGSLLPTVAGTKSWCIFRKIVTVYTTYRWWYSSSQFDKSPVRFPVWFSPRQANSVQSSPVQSIVACLYAFLFYDTDTGMYDDIRVNVVVVIRTQEKTNEIRCNIAKMMKGMTLNPNKKKNRKKNEKKRKKKTRFVWFVFVNVHLKFFEHSHFYVRFVRNFQHCMSLVYKSPYAEP